MASDGARKPRYDEGPDAAKRFERTLSRVLTVSKSELTKREAAYQQSPARKKPRKPQ